MVEQTEYGLTLRLVIVTADSAPYIRAVDALFREYAESLDFDLDFQNFQSEISRLPGDYAAPEGCLLLALADHAPIGCIALRKWSRNICEMKRLYVKGKFRGYGVGRSLAETLIEKAGRLGYRRMRLDTVPAMRAARALYQSLGFKEIDAYRFNPIEGARYMELDLAEGPKTRQWEKMP